MKNLSETSNSDTYYAITTFTWSITVYLNIKCILDTLITLCYKNL